MGNWRRVQIIGRVGDPTDGMNLHRLLSYDYRDPHYDWDLFGPLVHTGGLVGLPNFGRRAEFAVAGNLAERDYDVESVADHLRKLVAACPSLECMIHVGDENEADTVEATVTAKDGVVEVVAPMATSIPDISEDQVRDNFMEQLSRGRR